MEEKTNTREIFQRKTTIYREAPVGDIEVQSPEIKRGRGRPRNVDRDAPLFTIPIVEMPVDESVDESVNVGAAPTTFTRAPLAASTPITPSTRDIPLRLKRHQLALLTPEENQVRMSKILADEDLGK